MSLVVKFGALLFIVFLPTQYAIDLQLLGGMWILQLFPAMVFALHAGGATYPLYIGLIALAWNIVVALVVSMVTPRRAQVQ